MAYEFTKLNAVESIEELSASANILVEENGVIKKVSKDAIGGNASTPETPSTPVANSNYDIVAMIQGEMINNSTTHEPQIISQKTYDEVVAGGDNFACPKALISIIYSYGAVIMESISCCYYREGSEPHFIYSFAEEAFTLTLNPDDVVKVQFPE